MDCRLKLFLATILILGSVNHIKAKKCSRPSLERNQVFIYRTMGTINVRIHRCLYNNTKSAYSDISDHCLSAFKTGSFLDKWGQTNSLADRNSPIVLEEYVTTADPLRNLIQLRSGTTCRYDRGFCYDPSETTSYAAVWNTMSIPTEKCPTRLEQVFYGHVDFWNFSPENLKYLFFDSPLKDRSFYLKLQNYSSCHNKLVWYTDESGYIVSLQSLTQNYRPTKKLNEEYFPLKSKRLVSEAILKDCDLNSYSIDFKEQIKPDYLVDPQNLRVIFKLYQNSINENKHSINEFSRSLNKIRTFVDAKVKDLNTVKIMFGLYKTQVEKINNALNSLNQSRNEGQDYSSELNAFKIELFGNLTLLEKKIINYVDTADADILSKLNLSNLKLLVLDKKIKDAISKNDADIKLTEKKVENVTQNIDLNIQLFRKSLTQIEGNVQEKYNNLNKIIDGGKNSCEKEINLIKDTIKNEDENIKKEIIDTYLGKEKDFINNLNKVNISLSSLINSTDSKIGDLQQRLKDYKIKEDIKNSTERKLQNLGNDITATNQKLNNLPIKIKQEILAKLNPTLNSLENKSKSCIENIKNLRADTENQVDNTRKELIQLFKLDDQIVAQELKEAREDVTNKIIAAEIKFHELEVHLKDCKDLAEKNQQIILNEIRKNITSLYDLTNHEFREIDKNILNKYNSIMTVLQDRSRDFSQIIENMRFDFDKAIIDLKLNLIENFKLGDKGIISDIANINDTLSHKINLSSSKIEELESKFDEFSNKTNDGANKNDIKEIKDTLTLNNEIIKELPSKIEDEVIKKIKPSLKSFENCCKEVENLKENVDNNIKDLKNEFSTGILLTNTDVGSVNDTINEKIEECDKRIKILESKIKGVNPPAKKKSPSDDKIDYLIKQGDSTYATLRTNIDEVNNIKKTLKTFGSQINSLDSDVHSKDSHIAQLNRTIEGNKGFIKKLEEDVIKIKNSGDISDINKQILQHNSVIIENLNNVKLLQEQFQITDKNIDQLKNDNENSQKLLKQYEQEIQTLRQNLTTANNLISNNDKSIKDLKNEIEDLKQIYQQKEIVFAGKVSGLQTAIGDKGIEISELKKELANANKCCSDNDLKLKENDKEIRELRDEFRKAIDELKKQQQKFSDIINNPVEVESQ